MKSQSARQFFQLPYDKHVPIKFNEGEKAWWE